MWWVPAVAPSSYHPTQIISMMSASQIYIDLCRHLNETMRVSSVSNQFQRLPDNRERVQFARELLQQFDLNRFDNMQRNISKSAEEMQRYLDEARAAESWLEKVIAYTTALGNATMAADEAIILQERSDALKKAGKHGAADADAKRAQAHRDWCDGVAEGLHPPPSEMLIKQRLAMYKSKMPKLSHGQNEHITCASNAVVISISAHNGRFVMAVKDIEIGDVLAVERPYASVVLQKNDIATTHCHQCLQLCYNLIPCDRCPFAYFCSDECKALAWTIFHQYECPITAALLTLDYTVLTLATLRVALMASNEYRDIAYGPDGEDDHYEEARYAEVHRLCTNTHLRSNSDLFKRSINAAILFEVVRKNTSLLINEYDEEDNDKADAFKGLLLQHMQSGPSNFHELTEKPMAAGVQEASIEVGGGAYSFLSLINHSCSPNVVRQNYGNIIVLRALSRIRKGQQLYDNYGQHYAIHKKADRQSQLKCQYFFDCWCEACVNNWPLYDHLPLIEGQPNVSFEEIDTIRNGSREDVLRMLDLLIGKANTLEAFKPCKNLASVQECIKECFFRTTFLE